MSYSSTRVERTLVFKPATRRVGVGTSWQDVSVYDWYDVTQSRSGQRNTGWKQRIKDGSQAGSAYTRVVWNMKDLKPVICSVRARHSVSSASRYDFDCQGQPYAFQTMPNLPQPFSAGDRALRKAYDRLRQVRSEMNGSLFVGELREAVRMIRNPAKGLVTFFTNYAKTAGRLRRNLKDSKRSADYVGRAVADLWLEAQFGWKPFVSDIESAAQTIGRIMHDSSERRSRITSSAESSATSSDAQFPSYDAQSGLPVGYSPIFPRIQMIRERKSDRAVKYIVGLKSIMDGPTNSVSRVLEISGFTLENFVPTIYNLIPYSFLVDYFVNLGDIIESSWTDQSNVSWVVVTSRNRDSVALKFQYDAVLTAANAISQGYILEKSTVENGYSLFVRTTLDRQILPTLPIPQLTFSIPGADSLKWANMLALFRSSSRGLYSGHSRG